MKTKTFKDFHGILITITELTPQEYKDRQAKRDASKPKNAPIWIYNNEYPNGKKVMK